MKIEIITPDSTIYTGEASLVQFPGADGSFEVMHNHAPIISTLKEGKIKVLGLVDKTPIFFDIKGGVVEVSNNHILVLAE
jgi:F-type H+-transporting ATPase subunit epsilon